ncbi:MAG: HNH endonuclease [Candidatus Delongbacteria bacterium]|nr:HNH endonuclease [Candidatus Delongbacteria bacterium]
MMTISDADTKLLWGRAAGICSNPDCRKDLTTVLEKQRSYNIGEMAHVIAKSKDGPRGTANGGDDTYENLILLCPTCHKHIDKSPKGLYKAEQLFDWKKKHEEDIRSRGTDRKFTDISELKKEVSSLLIENRIIWEKYGPKSEIAQKDPASNSYKIWEIRKTQTIFSNNQKIINLIQNNSELLSGKEFRSFLLFKNHAVSFEVNHYCRLDSYTIFPEEFNEEYLNE